MTIPSAWRSLHHCSPRSEKMMRAVDEPITLMKKVCRPVSRRPSVMKERGDSLWNRLTHKFQTSEKFRSTGQKVSKSGFLQTKTKSRNGKRNNQNSLWKTKRADSRWLSSRDSKTRIPGRLWQKKYSKVEWNDRVSKKRNLSCSSRRRTTSTRSTTSSWTVIGTKSGSSWSSYEKSLWDGRIEAISKVKIRWIFEKRIGRRSRYCPWTHRQDSGITEWNQLHEWFDRFSRCWISTQWTFPRCQSTSVFHTSSNSCWNAKPFFWNAEPQQWAAKYLGHTWFFGKRFCKSTSVFFSTLSARVESLHHHMWWVNAKHQTQLWIRDASQDRQPEIHSTPVRDNFQRIMRQTNKDCRFRIFILTNSLNPATFACWKIRFKTEVCICSNFLRKPCCGSKKWRWLKQWMI